MKFQQLPFKEKLRFLIFKTIGTTSFIRIKEWKKINDYLNINENDKVLDVACGDGLLSCKIAKKGCIVYGIDISEKNIESAKLISRLENLNCHFITGNALNLPYPDDFFDKVVSSCALEHFKDDNKALMEINRVLKDNGELVMTVDSFSYPISDKMKNKHRKKEFIINYYTKEDLEEKLLKVGIKLKKSEYLFNSAITSYLINYIFIKSNPSLWREFSVLLYPFCSISDNLFGKNGVGYSLIIKAKKP